MSSKAAAIIPAAGSGSRMKAACPKQYLSLAGKPILVHTVEAFHRVEEIDLIVVVVPKTKISETAVLLREHGLDQRTRVIAGGVRRQDSVKEGVGQLQGYDIALVHDGARPLVSSGLIRRCLAGAVESGAAIAAVPVKDTLKRGGENNIIMATVDRTCLWQAQTPQAAGVDLLKEAFFINGDRDVTDEAMLLEGAGIPVTLVMGGETNIKITRPEDLEIAEKILMDRTSRNLRIGHGYDAHRFAEGRDLILGGVKIEHNRGLAGHSDADVVTHALCDAILGALGRGDIGVHFPDTSEEFKDIYSITLLERVARQMREDGYQLGNGDVTIICQEPRLAPHIAAMKKKLAAACDVDVESINIKATTEERMGFTGRVEGISTHAVVALHSVGREHED